MCLASAQLQQEAMERHRLEVRLGKLSHRRVLPMVLKRRQRLQGWRHQRRH